MLIPNTSKITSFVPHSTKHGKRYFKKGDVQKLTIVNTQGKLIYIKESFGNMHDEILNIVHFELRLEEFEYNISTLSGYSWMELPNTMGSRKTFSLSLSLRPPLSSEAMRCLVVKTAVHTDPQKLSVSFVCFPIWENRSMQD